MEEEACDYLKEGVWIEPVKGFLMKKEVKQQLNSLPCCLCEGVVCYRSCCAGDFSSIRMSEAEQVLDLQLPRNGKA